jgi:16S rRNA (adenine1518-N6/adenine1519-N6)-dimethyltransferase
LKKRFGQHFLSDPRILRRIVRLAGIQLSDTVVEIGPGAGALTRELAAAAKRVIAIEIDRDLIDSLRSRMPGNVEIIQGDALEFDYDVLTPYDCHVVGNLPYNITTPLFRTFIDSRRRIMDVTVMVQREMAERIVAKPDSAAYGPLSILLQFYATPKYGFTVAPGAFHPRPKVESAVIRLDWRAGAPDSRGFTDFVQRAFGGRRKKLINNLLHMYRGKSRQELLSLLQRVGVPPDARPEELSVEDFQRVYNRLL